MDDNSKPGRMQHKVEEVPTDATYQGDLNRKLLDAIPHPVWLIDRERKIIAINHAGTTFGAHIGDYCWCGIHGMLTISAAQRGHYLDAGTPWPGTQCGFCRADLMFAERRAIQEELAIDGHIWDCWWVPVDENSYLHYMVDITARRRAEAETEKNNEFMSAILNGIADAVIACDRNGSLTLINSAARRFHGIDDDCPVSDLKLDDMIFYEPDGVTRIASEDYSLKRTLGGIDVTNREMVIATNPKAPPVAVRANGRLIVNRQGEQLGAVITSHDITAIKSLEERLRQTQKMETIGTLAGGVAHDFNNILTVIMGCCALLMKKANANPELKPFLKQILDSSERAASLTHSLLAFGRKQAIRPLPADINHIVLAMKDFLEQIIGPDVHLETALSPDPLMVSVDRGQIEQVLMNLTSNARDAMPQGGSLRVEISPIDSEGLSLGLDGCKPGMYASLTVADTGFGMDKATMDKVFEPFFTTKEPGRGTGLGLSMAFGIIKQHEGTIKVSSEPGKGARFSIYLPIMQTGRDDATKSRELLHSGGDSFLGKVRSLVDP